MPEDPHPFPSSVQGIIWKVDRNATHDGPGIRTALYFKGCALRCRWCCNPEGQCGEPCLVFQRAQCSDCRLCLDACPAHAVTRQEPATIHVDQSKCDQCGKCVSECPTEALRICGQGYTARGLQRLLESDRALHRRTGGGLTCTGGDPLYQGKFLLKLLEECRQAGIHTVVETSAFASEELFERILQLVDLLFIDLKHMDPERHLEVTGKTNDLILSNLRCASKVLQSRRKDLYVRQVIVPGITDGRNIECLAEMAASLPFLSGVELLAYHPYGACKYDLYGLAYSLKEAAQPTPRQMEDCRRVLREKKVRVI